MAFTLTITEAQLATNRLLKLAARAGVALNVNHETANSFTGARNVLVLASDVVSRVGELARLATRRAKRSAVAVAYVAPAL